MDSQIGKEHITDVSRRSVTSRRWLASRHEMPIKGRGRRMGLTYALWSSSVDRGQIRLRTIESPICIFLVPDQIAPKLSVRVLANYGIDALHFRVPGVLICWRRLPVILALLRVPWQGCRCGILFQRIIALPAALTHLRSL